MWNETWDRGTEEVVDECEYDSCSVCRTKFYNFFTKFKIRDDLLKW